MWSAYQEKEEKLDGDAALSKLFRDIYQNADEDKCMQQMHSEINLPTLFSFLVLLIPFKEV